VTEHAYSTAPIRWKPVTVAELVQETPRLAVTLDGLVLVWLARQARR
jgi:hypothetical protein